MIKGPMGKSLGVKQNGTHLAFAAGTGAITFMDTAAYVARFVMGETDDNEKVTVGEDNNLSTIESRGANEDRRTRR